ncbi:hypothetical protein ACFXKF_36700 [Streptomyces scopuliridis]|uniref:hypothetical protein n=1 Tax=Streptomyces scopuliridis TaxID=452529 RepID=UPI00367BD831
MQRSLRRHIERAVNKSWNADSTAYGVGMAGVLLLFPDDAFADAPTWHPGPGFENCLSYSWLRSNGDGTATAVVAGVGPKERPGRDGGEWTEEEVWTVTADEETLLNVSSLWDKPHRITWMLDEAGAQIHREAYATHPVAAVETYWENFEKTWGFQPHTLEYGTNPLGEGRRWLLLTGEAGYDNIPSEVDLLRVSTTLARIFNAKARVYSYDRARRDLRGPISRVPSALGLRPIIDALHTLARP